MLTTNISTMRAEIARHIEADAVRGGHYWDGESGCFIGCLAHSNDAAELTRSYGLPLPLVRLCEHIFERLPQSERPTFFAQVGEAVGCDGKDLTRVHWQFLCDVLRHLPDTPARDVVARVIHGIDRLARGQEWPEARAAAEEAAAAEAAWARAEGWAAAAGPWRGWCRSRRARDDGRRRQNCAPAARAPGPAEPPGHGGIRRRSRTAGGVP